MAKLSAALDIGDAVTDSEAGLITFDKETDEVVLIYGADPTFVSLNGLGTGTEINMCLSRDLNITQCLQAEMDSPSSIYFWSVFKSFVTSGMAIQFPNLFKRQPQPVVTSQPQLAFGVSVETAVFAGGFVNCYVYYTTRRLSAEAMRVLIGVE